MKNVDVAVIGGGVLGCMTARELMRYDLSAVLIERQDDVCRGITRANAAIVYTGRDNKPGSLKARMTVRANADFDRVCKELDVEFIRRGSLLLSYDEACDSVLEKKLSYGIENNVPGLRILSGEEALELEPTLSAVPRAALYTPGTGTVNPWQLGIAAYENAAANGCQSMLGCSVAGIQRSGNGYLIRTDKDEVFCRAVINCAGLTADKVHNMLFEPELELWYNASDFLVFDRQAKGPGMILLEERPYGKGISLIPTVEGNLLVQSEVRELEGEAFAFRAKSREELLQRASAVVKGIDGENIIRCFAGIRPNPRHVGRQGKDISSFVISNPEPGFISLIGIKTPGLSCSHELGSYCAEEIAAYLGTCENKNFKPGRRAIVQPKKLSLEKRSELIDIDPDYGHIVCLCEDISEAEIKEAIRRGAKSVEAVKRRLGSGMGPCQGSRCSYAISRMLEVKS